MNELQSFYQLASDFCKFVQEKIRFEETHDTLISFFDAALFIRNGFAAAGIGERKAAAQTDGSCGNTISNGYAYPLSGSVRAV